MSLFDRLFRRQPDPRQIMQPLYQAVVHRARAVHWYIEGQVPDTLDGRFDMIAAVLSLVLLRLERDDLRHESVWLTELFVDDMEAQLRQIGIGDVIVGKHVGRMMSALGGRLSAYREGLAPQRQLSDALRRNLYRGEPVADDAVEDVEARLRALAEALDRADTAPLVAGALPT